MIDMAEIKPEYHIYTIYFLSPKIISKVMNLLRYLFAVVVDKLGS